MSERQKLRAFFSLWNQYARRGADRDDRLLWAARQLGQAVDSTSQLSDEDLDLLIGELRRQLRQGSNVVDMSGKPDESAARASKEQIWKVHQIESYLGWLGTPERLAGFLRDKFKVEDARQLSSRDAWRAIEALVGVAAQDECARSYIPGRKTTRAEKTGMMKRIKGVLKTWRAA